MKKLILLLLLLVTFGCKNSNQKKDDSIAYETKLLMETENCKYYAILPRKTWGDKSIVYSMVTYTCECKEGFMCTVNTSN